MKYRQVQQLVKQAKKSGNVLSFRIKDYLTVDPLRKTLVMGKELTAVPDQYGRIHFWSKDPRGTIINHDDKKGYPVYAGTDIPAILMAYDNTVFTPLAVKKYLDGMTAEDRERFYTKLKELFPGDELNTEVSPFESEWLEAELQQPVSDPSELNPAAAIRTIRRTYLLQDDLFKQKIRAIELLLRRLAAGYKPAGAPATEESPFEAELQKVEQQQPAAPPAKATEAATPASPQTYAKQQGTAPSAKDKPAQVLQLSLQQLAEQLSGDLKKAPQEKKKDLWEPNSLLNRLLSYAGLTAAGASVGALVDKQKRLRGAIIGALLGAGSNFARRKLQYGDKVNW